MTYAFVQVLPGLAEADYWRVVQALGEATWPGLVTHLAGPCEAGWRIIQVWEDEESYIGFERQHLWDALHTSKVYENGSAGPPIFEWLDVHHFVVGSPGAQGQRDAGGAASGSP